MASAIGFAITATDQTAAAFERVNARIEAFQKKTRTRLEAVTAPVRRLQTAMARFGNVSGLARVAGALGGVARAGTEAYQRVGQLVPLIGIIGSAASVAGVTRMVEAWTALGSRAGFAAQRIGLSAGQLTAFQGAGRLAGASAEGVTNGLQTLGQTMYDAIGGRAPEAIVMFRTLGIAFQDSAGRARGVADVMPEVADKIASIRNPFAQAQVAATLFGGAAEELLPFLRRGSAGIREYVAMAQRYGAISDVGARAAERLREAQARVSLAVDGLRNRIAERLEPVLTPLLMRFAEWIATSPQVAQGIQWLGEKVEQLGKWIEGGGIQRFGETVQGWLEPIGSVVHFLGGDGGVLGAVEALMALMAARFALGVIGPWLTLSKAIAGATINLTRFAAAQAAGAGGAGMLGRLGGLAGGLALGAAGWEGLNWLQGATEPQGNGLGNLLHNFLFEGDPRNWTRGYHPGQERGGAPRAGSSLGRPDQSSANIGSAPQGGMAVREKQAYDYFISQGRSPQVAAGIVASLERESLGNEKNNTGDGGTAYGIGQWHADRQEHFRQIFGHDIRQSTLGEQLQFKRMELDGTGGDAGSATAGQMMRGYGTTARQAGGYDSQYAERPADRDGEASRRGALAEAILSRQMQRSQADPIAPPSAQGAPLALASPDRRDDGRDDRLTRLHITGSPGLRAQVLESSSAVKVEGPLVEKPGLLGAMA